MKLSKQAVDRPRVVIVLSLLVILLAGVAAFRIPVQLTPAIHMAVVLVTVPYPGAEPTEVEEQITRKIEKTLERLDKVDFISSTSMRGASVTQVLFLDGVDAKRARDDVAHLVDEVRRELPLGREVQPMVNHVDFDSMPIMLVNLSAPDDLPERTLRQIAEEVKKEVEAIEGVSNTQLFGAREQEIHVNIDPDLLTQYGISLADVRGALASAHALSPGGSLNSRNFDLQVRNETKFRDIEDIRETVISERNGRLIRVSDVAEVLDTFERLKNVAELDGQTSATLIVYKEANINTLGAANAIKACAVRAQARYPQMTITCTRDSSQEIAEMFEVLGGNAWQGALLLMVVLVWSIGLRSSVLVVVALPFSLAVALLTLYVLKIPISNMVLFSSILVMGMVIDGALIVSENIHRHIEMGKEPAQAAKDGIDEVSLPVIAADLTTIAAYLPMMLVPGIMGDFMGVMPMVVSVALLGSVISDHFLIPVLASFWYRQQEAIPRRHDNSDLPIEVGWIHGIYGTVLDTCLRHRWLPYGFCLLGVLWGAGLLATGKIAFTFFPPGDRGEFEIYYELPLGYSVEQTALAARVFEGPLEELRRKGELVHYVTAVGSSGGLSTRLEGDPAAGPEFGKIMVQLNHPSERNRSQAEIIEDVRTKIQASPGMKFRVQGLEEGPPGGSDVAVRLTGDDLSTLGELSREIAARLKTVKGTVDVYTDYRDENPELVIEPNPATVALFQMTEADVSRAVQTAILGDTAIEIALGDEDVTLRLQAKREHQRNREDLSRMMLRSPSGRMATLGEVAELRRATGLYAVNRYQTNRAVTVRNDLVAPTIPDDVFKVLRTEILTDLGFQAVAGSRMDFIGQPGTPAAGLRAQFTGENEERDEGFFDLLRAMIVGVVLIFTILVMQFNSFRQAIVVMMTVPLSFIGVIAFLWVFHFDFSLAAFIGLVSLTGVVVNDAIVLVDFANQARRRGLTVHDACFEAGMIRARPVVLTMLSTVGNIFPLFLNLSGGAEFWRPLSGSIALGLCFATGLTLIVIPVSYSMIYDPRGRSPKTDWPPKLLPEDQAVVDRLLAERAGAAAAVS